MELIHIAAAKDLKGGARAVVSRFPSATKLFFLNTTKLRCLQRKGADGFRHQVTGICAYSIPIMFIYVHMAEVGQNGPKAGEKAPP